MNNHNVNLGRPGKFFSKELAFRCPSLLHITDNGNYPQLNIEVSKLKAKNGYLGGCVIQW